MKLNNKQFESNSSGLKAARRYLVKVGDVKIDFEQDEKFATMWAKSFGIEHGEPVARIEQI